MGKKEQIIERLNNEIKWCKENKSTAPNKEFAKGFIKGLKKAILLIKKTATK